MRQDLEFYYQRIAHVAEMHDPKGSLEPVLSLVNQQIFVAYDKWEKLYPGHINMMWDKLVSRLKRLPYFKDKSFIPKSYIQKAAIIMDCQRPDSHWPSLGH